MEADVKELEEAKVEITDKEELEKTEQEIASAKAKFDD